jgi:hypothetical protein
VDRAKPLFKTKDMQFQIEYNEVPLKTEQCLICDRLFEMTEAKVIICDDQGKSFGEVCPKCLKKGFGWLSDRFEQLNHPKRKAPAAYPEKTKVPVGV